LTVLEEGAENARFKDISRYMMDLIIDVLLAATDILTLVFGLAGFFLSVLLLFSSETVRWLGEKLNKSFTLVRLSPLLDRTIETNRLAYRHPFLIGSFFTIGSLFVLHFLYSQVPPGINQTFSEEILYEFLLIVAKLGAFLAILIGIALLLAPEKVRKIEDRLNAWIDTTKLFSDLDRPRPQIDHIFLRYPRISGAIGLLASFSLTILSISNFTR
jgi:hypothetical protein